MPQLSLKSAPPLADPLRRALHHNGTGHEEPSGVAGSLVAFYKEIVSLIPKETRKVVRKTIRKAATRYGPEIATAIVTGVLTSLLTVETGKKKKKKKKKK
jgi:hypothetical protein